MKKIGLIIIFSILLASCGSELPKGTIYQILIKNQPVESNASYSQNGWKKDSNLMKNAQLFECENPGWQYGYLTISKWNSADELKSAYEATGKPEDELNRIYTLDGEISGIGDDGPDAFYAITVFNFPREVLSTDDYKPKWDLISDWMKKQDGFISAQYFESIPKDVTYRYVNVAKWSSITDYYKMLGDSDNFFNTLLADEQTKSQALTNIYKLTKEK